MKKLTLIVLFITVFTLMFAETSITEKLQQFGEVNGKMYVQPFTNAFGVGLNSGLYQTAKVLSPFHFGLNFSIQIITIPDEDKTFMAQRPDIEYMGQYLYQEETIENSTCFGKPEGGTFHANPLIPGTNDLILPGGADLAAVPFATPQFNLGLPFGNEILLKYFPSREISPEIGSLDFFAIGLKHSISQYIPLIPIDIAVQGVYQKLSLGDIVELKTTDINLQVSKKLLMLTFYGGLNLESAKLSADYTTTQVIPGTTETEEIKVAFDSESDVNFRANIGMRFRILILNTFVDYNICKYPTICAGLGLSF